MFTSWLFRRKASAIRPRSGRSIHRSPPLEIESLEDRCVPATFSVNTLADTVAVNLVTGQDATGHVSLRGAISAANATPGGNTVLLTLPGDYRITIPGAGEDNNATGDFDILPSGGNLSILNTSGGTAAVDGGGLDRVFDINPTAGPTPTGFTVTIQNLTIEDGRAVTTTGNPDGPDASGGGIRAVGATSVTLNNVILTNNSATADGGGIAMENAQVSTKWTLTINGGTVSNNHAGDAGGGVESDGTGKININAGTVITGNTSTNQGAGIWLDAVGPGNVASVAVTSGGNGYTTPPMVVITPAAGDMGTGATAVATIANGMVTGVTITNGGTGYAAVPTISFTGGGGTGATATATLNNTFQSATLKITGATITSNQAFAANNVGGGIGNAGNGAVTITSSTVANNLSGGVGGGFGDENNVGSLLVLNSTFANNVAIGNGGGISSGGTSTTIEDSTITGNTSHGTAGVVAAVLVTNGGSGYSQATPPTVTFSAPGGMGNTTATGNALVNAAGQVIGVVITDAGTGYTTAPTVTFTAPTVGTTATGTAILGGVGGGVSITTTPFTLHNTIVANNFSNSGGMNFQGTAPDFFGVVSTGNGNFIGNNDGNLLGISNAVNGNQIGTPTAPLDPLLGPLQNNGGPTLTEAPLQGSTVINTGVNGVVPAVDPITNLPLTDQRGDARIFGGTVDVGAVEAIPLAGIAGRVKQDGTIWLATSNGTGFTNTLATQWNPAVNWEFVQTGDFNGDGKTDIIGFDPHTGQWWVAVSNGTTFTTTLWATWSTAVTWVDVHVADVDGDGKADIVGRIQSDGQWWVALSTGTSFVSHLWDQWNPTINWQFVQTADLNGDGKADIVGRDPGTGLWWTAMSTGSSFLNQLWGGWNPSLTWVDVHVADLNGDGKADLIGRVLQSGGWYASLSTGTNFTTVPWAAWNPAVNWTDVQVGDLNGDGKADLVGRDPTTGIWMAAISTGTSSVSQVWGQWSPAVTWVDVQLADVNGDGREDIVGREADNGIWWAALSSGSGTTNHVWGQWSPAVTWVDVHAGDYTGLNP